MTLKILYYLEKALDEAINNAYYDYLCTIENTIDTKKWFQIKYDSINLYYPYSDNPLTKLNELKIELSKSMTISEWEPNVYLTIEHYSDDENHLIELKDIIELYLEKVMDCVDLESWRVIEI
jgi:hypothetical protein